jgi:hypothetical protein
MHGFWAPLHPSNTVVKKERPLRRNGGRLEEERLDRLSLQHLVIAMPYATQFSNAYYFGIELPRLAFIKGRGCEATEV